MTSKRWLILFLSTTLLLIGLYAGFNILADPFGVFGDPVFHWYSYNSTMNPRVAKVTYLEAHHEEFDSYIIGCSSTSGYSVPLLNEYLDASFYNMISYGADMLDAEQLAEYLVEHYTVKNLVLNVYLDNAARYDWGEDDIAYRQHYKVSGADALDFYLQYLFATPQYALDKLSAVGKDTEMQQYFDVFDMNTGAYDKRVRDGEQISDLEHYYQDYPVFQDYPAGYRTLPELEHCMQSVAAIRDLCEERGINLYVINAPVYYEYLNYFSSEDLAAYYTALAEVTPFWDFIFTSVSYEPRYFYDATHFRNAVGDMALACMFSDDSVYRPAGFGTYVTTENVSQQIALLNENLAQPEEAYTTSVPILLYHNIDQLGDAETTISAETFQSHMLALKEAGYNTVSFDELISYVYQGVQLPDNPVVITFDDGYLSNYTIAYPILRELEMKATIFVIGSSVGKDTYKDTGIAITPHFSYSQAQEMIDSGLISIQSHTYDMHQWEPYEEGPTRYGVSQMDGERESGYIAAFREDLSRSIFELEEHTTETMRVLAFPHGYFTPLTQWLSQDMGFLSTLGTEPGINVVIKGLPQSLLGMNRNIVDEIPAQSLLALLAM